MVASHVIVALSIRVLLGREKVSVPRQTGDDPTSHQPYVVQLKAVKIPYEQSFSVPRYDTLPFAPLTISTNVSSYQTHVRS